MEPLGSIGQFEFIAVQEDETPSSFGGRVYSCLKDIPLLGELITLIEGIVAWLFSSNEGGNQEQRNTSSLPPQAPPIELIDGLNQANPNGGSSLDFGGPVGNTQFYLPPLLVQEGSDQSFHDDENILLLGTVRERAGNIQTDSYNFPEISVLASLEKMIDVFKKIEFDQLKAQWNNAIPKLKQLKEALDNTITGADVWVSGRDSSNRKFILNPRTSKLLRDPEVIAAILAIQIARRRKFIEIGDIIANLIQGPSDMNMASMLYYAFQVHTPMVLECMPDNQGSDIEADYLEAYLQRKQVQRDLIPVMEGVYQAYADVTNKSKPEITPQVNLSSSYERGKWPSYVEELVNPLIDKINQKRCEEGGIDCLIKNSGSWDLSSLVRQAYGGLETLCKKMEVVAITEDHELIGLFSFKIQLSYDDFIRRFATTQHILCPSISHNFDRLHTLACLIDNRPMIEFSDGKKTTMQEILVSVFQEFATKSSEENAIAAEQFYMRLRLIYDRLLE